MPTILGLRQVIPTPWNRKLVRGQEVVVDAKRRIHTAINKGTPLVSKVLCV